MKKFESVKELERFYNKFKGQSLKEIRDYIHQEYPTISLSTNKGIVGQVLEALIGNAPNSDPNPDVQYLNVELKVLPLRKIGDKVQPKERSKIKSLNYNTILDQKWHTSDVKAKMNKMLFLLYEQPTGKTYKDWQDLTFKGTMFYELEKEKPDVVQEDWKGIYYKVKSEIAHEISEGDSMILGASTSGAGKIIKYGNNKEAKQRSYSLKHSYLKVFYSEKIRKQKFTSIGIPKSIEPQDYILNILNKKLKGKGLKNVVDKYNVKFSESAKSSFPILINKVLNIKDKAEIRELAENNIIIKTVPIKPNGKPWEAMSFPKFSLVDLIYEDWNGDKNSQSIFRSIISQGFIFLPVIKEKYKPKGAKNYKYMDWSTWVIGQPVYWKASEKELKTIMEEWKKAKNIVEKEVKVEDVSWGEGTRQNNNLLKMSETKIIHIRPHTSNSKNLDIPYQLYTEGRVSICWQSFWLNKDFVESVIRK